MKKEILRISGHKNLKDFYKEFPDEDSFKAKYGKELKKAQVGAMINKTNTQSSFKPINLDDIYNEYDFGNNMEESQQVPQQQSKGAGGMDMGGLMKMFGGEGGGDMSSLASSLAKYGTSIPKAQSGFPVPLDSSLDGSPGYQQQYNQNNNKIGSQINNDNFVSLTDDEVANKNGMYNGYSDANGPNGNKRVKSPMTGQQQVDLANNIASKAGFVGQAYNIIQGNKEAARAANQNKQVTAITRKAQNSYAQNVPENKFVRPEDNIFTGESLFPVNGVGTNVLAKNGSSIKKMYNGGNTQPQGWENYGGDVGATVGNAFFPGMGEAFRPAGQLIGMGANLLDSNIKSANADNAQAQRDLKAMSMEAGFNSFRGQNASYVKNGGNIASYENGGYMNPEYNPQLITMFGDHNSEDFADYANKFRAGGHLKSYTPPSERAMEIYEDGGGVKSYGLGGELQTHWGGGAETISQNPYLPGTGETVMFRGKSHKEYSPNGETGIGVTYGGNPVEVERGEPMVELEEGGVVDPETGEVQKSGVVFGNLKIPNQYLDLLGDKSAKGQKFKNYVAKLSKTEARQNGIIEKSTNELDGFTPITPFDKLKMTALQANIQGANMKLKDIADKKINAAHLQNAINDTAEEHGLVADDLARGNVKIDKEAMQTREARWGDAISKAQDGKTTPVVSPLKFKNAAEAAEKGYKKGADGKYHRTIKKFSTKESETKAADALGYVPAGQKQSTSGTFGKVTPDTFAAAKAANSWYPGWSTLDPKNKADVKTYQRAFNARAKANGSSAHIDEDGDFGEQTVSARIDESKKSEPANTEEELTAIVDEQPSAPTPPAKSRFPWEAYANQALKYLRPTDQEDLDASQLYPEMYAMASNQLEPVPAQGYHPDLGVPYDISFQDQLNANQADYNSAQRMAGYNPAAQANLNAQKYQANQKVLGDQFRANQAMKDKVYGENRNILNDAKLKNLDIYDRQYGRQSEAVSNTKATTQAALNSIADKYAKNKLENRTLGVYENMYNYRFGKDSKADNWNPLQFFDTEAGGAKAKGNQDIAGLEATRWDKNGTPIAWKKATDKSDNSSDDAMEAVGGIKNKNGGTHKKNYKNGSVVRAYKNL